MKDVQQKVILIGQEGVGKTSLVHRYCYDDFKADYKPTTSIKLDKKSREDGDNLIHTIFWDLGGQLTRGGDNPSFFEKTDGVMVILDLEDPSSYVDIQGILSFIEKKIPGKPRILIANKADKLESEAIDLILTSAKVEKEDVIITSAASGLNVEYAFVKLSRKIVNQSGS